MYKVDVLPRDEREEVIEKQLKASDKEVEFYEFRNTSTKLKVIRVDVSVPVYRMENFRTYTAQHGYIAREKQDPNYFIQNQEVQSVQQKQHEILDVLARKGRSGSVTPIYDVLKKEGQRETILISSSGVVINGNRRLAAMRELHAEAESGKSAFSHVNCSVLPSDATADEILDVEANLQAKPETKLDYDWIGDAELVQKLLSRGKSSKAVARQLNRTEADIRNTVAALAEADLYLKEWLAAEGDYDLLPDDAEQLFKDLPKLLKGKSQALKDSSRVIAWTLLQNKSSLPGRVYNFNRAIGKLSNRVLKELSEELELPEKSHVDENEEVEVDFGGDERVAEYASVTEALRQGRKDEDVVNTLIDACQNAIEHEKGQQSGEAALRAVSQAHSKLAAIDLTRAAKGTRPAMEKQLQAISKMVGEYLEKLDKLGS